MSSEQDTPTEGPEKITATEKLQTFNQVFACLVEFCGKGWFRSGNVLSKNENEGARIQLSWPTSIKYLFEVIEKDSPDNYDAFGALLEKTLNIKCDFDMTPLEHFYSLDKLIEHIIIKKRETGEILSAVRNQTEAITTA